MTIAVLGRHLTTSYWSNCHGPRKNLTEALGLMESVLDGEVPAWLRTNYTAQDGTLDLSRFFWESYSGCARPVGPSQWSRLRNLFGGYCEKVFSPTITRNEGYIPWRAGGCVPGAPENLVTRTFDSPGLEALAGKMELEVTWQWPAIQGSSEIMAHVVQWKSGLQGYSGDRSKTVGVTNLPANSFRTVGILVPVDRTYSVRVASVNHSGTGAFAEYSGARDDVAPTLSSATVDGDELTLTFSEPLDGDSVPPVSSFHVGVDTPSVGQGDGLTTRRAGVDAVAVSGRAVTLTLDSPVVSGEVVRVSYTVPMGADAQPVRGSAENPAVAFAHVAVTNATAAHTVVSIAAPATPVAEGVAAAFTLTRWEVSTPPALAELTVQVSVAESGATIVGAPPTEVTFAAGSTSATLTVATEDDEASEAASTVTATVVSGVGYAADADSGSAEVVVTDDDVTPAVMAVSVTSDPGADHRWAAGDRVELEVRFSEAVTVDVSGGTPTLEFWTGWAARRASYSRGSGTATLTFVWDVVPDGHDPRPALIFENGLALNGGTIRNAANVDANLAFTVTPAFTSAAIAEPPSGSRWSSGESVSVTLSLNSTVVVDTAGGTPGVDIRFINVAGQVLDAQAGYVGGTGTRSLRFAYPVTESDGSVWYVQLRHDSLALNGGSIRNAAGADALLPHVGDKLNADPDANGLAVDDARANENVDSVITFRVRLAPPQTIEVSVAWATEDGTARAGEDYTASQDTVTFAPGETEKTFDVPILSDTVDEGEETFTVRLSDATPAYLAAEGSITRATATGTIVNTDAMPKAWLARFGRTVAEQAIAAVETRLEAPRVAGVSGSVAGRSLGVGEARDGEVPADEDAARSLDALTGWLAGGEERRSEVHALSGHDLLTGSRFTLTSGSAETGFASFWGLGAVTRFDGREDSLALDGEVSSAMLGADFSRDRWLAGLMVSVSRGAGGYRSPEGGSESGAGGEVESTLTSLFPYGRYEVSERLSFWGLAGMGEGTLTLTQADRAALRPELSFLMGAAGMRGVLAGREGDAKLALKTDAMAARTSTEAVTGSGGNLAATDADVTRLRLALEGSRPVDLGGTAVLTPSLEVGLRHDGGDAETGFGADFGAGLALEDPARGISSALRARGLLTHEADGFRERGISGSLSFDPAPETERGVALSLSQTLGGPAWGGAGALFGRGAMDGPVAGEPGPGADDLRHRRFDARVGYGVGVLGDRWTVVPEVGLGLSESGREQRLGARLVKSSVAGLAFETGVEATRGETEGAAAAHGVALGFGWRLDGARRSSFDLRVELARREVADAPPEDTVGLSLVARW